MTILPCARNAGKYQRSCHRLLKSWKCMIKYLISICKPCMFIITHPNDEGMKMIADEIFKKIRL